MSTPNIHNLLSDVAHNLAPIDNLVGFYLNRYSYSDINPIGRVVRVVGKNTVEVAIVRPTTEWPINKADLKFEVGGFSAVCLNGHSQKWQYEETGDTIKFRVSRQQARTVGVSDQPCKYYDYNF